MTIEETRPPGSRPWLAIGISVAVLLVAVVWPMATFGGQQIRGQADEKSSRRPAVRSGGVPFKTRVVTRMGVGDGPRQTPVYKMFDDAQASLFSAVFPSVDGSLIWVVDSHKGDARLRSYDATSGQMVKTVRAPVSLTLFTTDYRGDFWAVEGGGNQPGQSIVHLASDGKVIRRYPLPPNIYARSISVEPNGTVWILNEEYTVDPVTLSTAWGGALLPIVDAKGVAVPDPKKLAIAGGAFIGLDGRLYSLKGQMPKDGRGYPAFSVLARDKKGALEEMSLPKGYRPFMADAGGRVYAQRQPGDAAVALGVSSLGDRADESTEIRCFTSRGEVARLPVMLSGEQTQMYPAGGVLPAGGVVSASWSDDGLSILRSDLDPSRVGESADEDVSPPKARVVFVGDQPLSGDPYFARDDFERDMWHAVYDGLVSFDASLTPQPNLASAIPAQGEGVSADGKVIEWRMASGRQWSDGKPVTAQDVVATYEYLVRPSVIPRAEPFPGFRYIKSVEARGDVVRVELIRPYGPAPVSFFPFVLPRHVLEATGGTMNAGLYARPMGSGPYRVVRWDEAGTLSLAPNRYAARRPRIARLDVVFAGREKAERLARDEGIPVLWTWVPLQSQPAVRHEAASNLVESETGRWFGLLVNTRRQMLSSQPVRSSLIAAYPVSEVLSMTVPGGSSGRRVGPFQTAAEPINTSSESPETTGRRLADALASIGYVDTNGDGVLNDTGKPLRFSWAQASRVGIHEIEPDVVDTYKRILLDKAKLQTYNGLGRHYYYEAYSNEGYLARGQHFVGAGVFPGFIDAGWGSEFDPADEPSWTNQSGRSVTFVKDRELEQLHAQARASYDSDERARLSRRIRERVERLSLAYFERPELRVTYRRDIKGYSPAPFPAGEFYNVDKWEVSPR